MDYFLFQKINSLVGSSECLDSLGIFLASYWQYFLVVALAIFLFLGSTREEKIKNRIMVGLSLASAVISRLIFTEIIRLIWSRPRPFVAHRVNLLISHDTTASFPSGHMAFFFALSIVVFLYNKKAGLWFLVASFLLGLARIFVGVHYPSDILAGIVLGLLVGYLTYHIYKRFLLKRKPPD